MSSKPVAIRVFALGAARLEFGLAKLDPSAETLFCLGLYLAFKASNVASRKELQQILWPYTAPRLSAHRLRQSILRLRKFGLPIETIGKTEVRLSGDVATDFNDFVHSSEYCGNAALANQSLFGGFEPKVSPAFSDWLESQKTRIASLLTRTCLQQIGKNRHTGNWAEVGSWAQTGLRHSPENEELTLALAESLAMQGDKLESVRTLDAYLAEVGSNSSDLRVAPGVMRKRIVERMPTRSIEGPQEIGLVGRQAHLAQLVTYLDDVRAGCTRACLVSGEPGVGKSRLISEFLSFAALQGVVGHRIYCRASDSKQPLSALLELIPSVRAMRGAIGSDPDTLAFLDGLTTHRPDKAKSAHTTSGPRPVESRLHAALADIVDAVSEETPIVVAIEDCQWIDLTSATVVDQLIARLKSQRVFILLSTRPVDERRISEATNLVEILLPPLDEESSTRVLSTIVQRHGHTLGDRFRAWCTSVAEGNPLFLHQLANHWLETGDEHGVPASLTAVLRQRLSRLSVNALQVLQTASLLENHSTIQNIEAVLEYPPHELLRSIDELATARMIRSSDHAHEDNSTGRLHSRHDLIADTALMQLSSAARSYLHRRSAAVLEKRIEDTRDASTLWSCAKHWHLAGDGTQAFRLAKSCAHHLLEAELPGEAIDAFSRARQFCTKDSDLLEVLEGLVIAYHQSSDWARVMTLVAEARTVKNRIAPEAGTHDDLELMLRRAEWQTMDWEHILAHSLMCLSAEEASVAHRLEAGVMSLMLLSLRGDEERGRATFNLMNALSNGVTTSNPEFMLQARMIFGTAWGALDDAVQAAGQLIAEQRKKKDVGAVFRSLCNAAITLRVAGRFAEAVDSLNEAIDLSDRHRTHLSKTIALPLLAHLAIERGLIDDARKSLAALQDCAPASGDRMRDVEIAAIQARLHLFDGDYQSAKRIIEVDLSHMRTDHLPHKRAYWNALYVATQLGYGGIPTDESLVQLEAEHMLTRGNIFQAFACFVLYAGLIRCGQETKANRILKEYLDVYRREPWPAPMHLLHTLLNSTQNSDLGGSDPLGSDQLASRGTAFGV
jgi:DNA-binding SARP family transcriptional activator/tetratricopeptide (TPR) repeat protein